MKKQKVPNVFITVLKKRFCVLFTIVIIVTSLPLMSARQVHAATLKNPKKDSAGVVTWDCVWFGSYPQSEVKNPTAAITGATYNSNGDATVGGTKYRRIRKSDATYSSTSSGYYNWNTGGDSNGYHYFKYEPIKWRVLSVNGNDAFLLADVGLDGRKYDTEEYASWLAWIVSRASMTWEKCTLRNFLNNQFLNTAFTSSQQNAIYSTNVMNDDNPTYKTDGGNNTTDKIYLLSLSEISNKSYGFDSKRPAEDLARRAKISHYAYAMGVHKSTENSYLENCWWWLRSPGDDFYYATSVESDGCVDDDGCSASNSSFSVRPVLHLNLLSSNLYSYAGTVSSNGKVVNVAFKTNSNKQNSTKKPKSTVIIKITKKKKSLKIRWKKTKGASGYQIQYATNKKFKKAKKVTVKGINKTSKTIKKLKSKKKYYLRVRTYVTVKGKKYYSAWSKVKKKKVG